MRITELNPNQIVTLNDYPVHSNKVLSEYFSECKLGRAVPLVPAISKDMVEKYLEERLRKKFEGFREKNPEAEYFMLDGSHRTTALTLAGRKIAVIIYEKTKDIIKARELVTTGQILENGTLDYTLEENCKVLNKHFKEKPYFQTVEDKTRKMIRERVISEDMIN